MASYTGNLNLKKPALDDDALITDINNNMDILDAAVNGIQDGLAIVANGNTHVAITSGQFVYVRNHGTLTEGLYVASSNIAANATLSTSNLTADSAGGLNALNSNITNINTRLQGVQFTQFSRIEKNTSYQITYTAFADVTIARFSSERIYHFLVDVYDGITWLDKSDNDLVVTASDGTLTIRDETGLIEGYVLSGYAIAF